MSIRIRTRRANGEYSDQRYMTEAAALEALEYRLYAHRRSGHLITRTGDTYLVTDGTGAFVQETVFLSSNDPAASSANEETGRARGESR